jgi:hypothetical protein
MFIKKNSGCQLLKIIIIGIQRLFYTGGKMNRSFFIFIIFLLGSGSLFSWGSNGHRISAKIAEKELSSKSTSMLKTLIAPQTLPSVSNWMDEIKSIKGLSYMNNLHYVNLPEGENYWDAQNNPDGDAIRALCYYRDVFIDARSTNDAKAQALKIIVHIVADIHQPLHAGMPQDRGGNDIPIIWFGEQTNLHMVWDEKIIDSEKLSYTEYVDFIYPVYSVHKAVWSNANILAWVEESVVLRDKIYEYLYDSKKKRNKKYLEYKYRYDFLPDLHTRLTQAGIRLAAFINEMVDKRQNTFCEELKKRTNNDAKYGIPKVL